MSVEFMMGARGAGNTILRSNPAEAVVSAINERLFESADTLQQRAQLNDISFRLRTAFSFDPETLPQLPIQLGNDYHKASAYVEQAVKAWLESQELSDLFGYLRLDDATEAGIRNLLLSSIQIQAVASWLCGEFGSIRTSRQALHARRYIAVKLTSDATSAISAAAGETEESRAKRQAQLDIWTDLECPIQNSLHYRTVIAPLCNWLLMLESEQHSKVVGLRIANEDMPFVEQPLNGFADKGTDFVDASVLRKSVRSVAS